MSTTTMVPAYLQSQFERIYWHFSGKNVATTLQHMAEVLCCTKRNARIVLGKMSERGWIDWLPMRGRGNKSSLVFCCSLVDLEKQSVWSLWQKGEGKAALAKLNYNNEKLCTLLAEHFGVFNHAGRSLLRLAYPAASLARAPAPFSKKTNIFFAQMIFNGLTKLNCKTNRVESDLAHRWHCMTPLQWRFFLRSDIYLHDGSQLTTADVVASLSALSKLPLYAHIKAVHSPQVNVIDVFLKCADCHLLELLALPQARIFCFTDDCGNSSCPTAIGSGPYRVETKSNAYIKLTKHSRFFGHSPLIDEIELWSFPDQDLQLERRADDLNANLIQRLSQSENTDLARSTSLVNGAIFVWLNRVSGLAKEAYWASYLQQMLTSIRVTVNPDFSTELQKLVPAFGMMPGWQHAIKSQRFPNLSQPKTLKLAYPEGSHVLHRIALMLQQTAHLHNIELEILPFSDEEMACFQQHISIDLWLNQMQLEHHNDFDFFAWLFSHEHLSRLVPIEDLQHMMWLLNQWRDAKNNTICAKALSEFLTLNKQVVPLFHQWEERSILTRLSAHHDLQTMLWCPPTCAEDNQR